jgi:hypothetical protein
MSNPLETYQLTRTNVARAGKCPTWQKVRKEWLKDLTTEQRLAMLKVYLAASNYASPDGVQCCDHRTRWIQVYHYLNVLARTGHIAPVDRGGDLEHDRIRILKG